jgi:nitrous oxide reductase
MSERELKEIVNRRNFLLKAASGTAGAVAAVATGVTAAEAASPASATPSSEGGYHETPHIRKYYELTRF